MSVDVLSVVFVDWCLSPTTQRHTKVLGRPDAFYKQFSQEVVQVRLVFP